jgi:CBS domain-containing membrane protein
MGQILVTMIQKIFYRVRGGGVCPPQKSYRDIFFSFLGAFLGIYLISTINHFMQIEPINQLFVVGSFGASAVLVYGAPQADFSQPRNLLGGHFISALIGVAMFEYVNMDIAIVSALAVSLSIVAMHLTRTLHPPGGATALLAIIGSNQIHTLGFMFAFTPILTGAVLLLLVALVVNNQTKNKQKHYPRYWF